ncbi:uncharacterized protein ACB058_009625 isoform 1-T2 [Synchiropus picturatus]
MDVSIAVSLIRGQMGTVVERAVNGAVETVLAEMLKVVGVKFEELKAQVALMKRDMLTLQREKVLKEKENENVRAKLRYTELKLKYYRQGVEEELQQRASSANLVRVQQPLFPLVHIDGAGLSSTDASPSCSTHTTNAADELEARNHQECISPASRHVVQVGSHSEERVEVSDSSDAQTDVTCSSQPVVVLSNDAEQDDDCEWTLTEQPHTGNVDVRVAPPTVQNQQPIADGPSLAESPQTFSTSQVKQEEDDQVICIKEEPEEEQEVMSSVLLDRQLRQSHVSDPENQISVPDWCGPPSNQRNRTGVFNAPAQTSESSAIFPPGHPAPPRQMVRSWPKDLTLYEEYKLRRNELRRRNLNRRRELEKTLPQPLLADMLRDRREKTRLRVARWRAKRKLQACLDQAQGGAAALSQTGFPTSTQQPIKSPGASTSSAPLAFISPSTSQQRGINMTQVTQHTLTSSSYQHINTFPNTDTVLQ